MLIRVGADSLTGATCRLDASHEQDARQVMGAEEQRAADLAVIATSNAYATRPSRSSPLGSRLIDLEPEHDGSRERDC